MYRPPLVLLHAFPLNSGMFDAIRPLLLDVELITPDQRGFGSRPLGDDLPSLDRAVDDVIALLDERAVDRAVIGGVSMGGYVALALLARFGDRVAGLVLADTRSTADSPEAAENRRARADNADTLGLPPATELVAPLLGPSADDDTVERAVAIARKSSASSYAWAQRAMAARGDTTDVLAAAPVPVLILVGADDAITPPEEAEAMAAVAIRPTVIRIDGAGHLTALERPAAFARAIIEWYRAEFSAG